MRALTRRLAPLTAAVALCAACNTPQPAAPTTAAPPPDPKPAPSADAAPSSPGLDALRDAAKTYTTTFKRIAPDGAWAHTLCRPVTLPQTSGPAASGMDLGPPDQEGRSVPHTRKLYWLYASDPDFYGGMRVRAPGPPPAGFSIVKEAWTPAKRDAAATPPPDAALRPHARWGDHEWYGADRASLFIMHYTGDAKAPNTDAGWVYAVASPDGAKLLESGTLDACANCHKSAGPHRLYGL